MIGMAVASSSTLGHLMEAALEAYFKYNSNQLFTWNIFISFNESDLAYLFITDFLLHLFSNGRHSTYMGISVDDFAVRSTASAAVRVRASIRRKITSSLFRVAKKTSVLQRHPGGGHASN